MVKRFMSVLLVVVTVCCMATSVGAASLEGTVDFTYSYLLPNRTPSHIGKVTSLSFPRSANSGSVDGGDYLYHFDCFSVPASVNLGASGSMSVYFSFYFSAPQTVEYVDLSFSPLSESAFVSNYLNVSNWSGYYYDTNGSVVAVPPSVSVKSFDPFNNNDSITSPGISVSVNFDLGDNVATGVHIDYLLYQFAGSTSDSTCGMYVPSIRIVSAETAADIAALEGIADQLAENNRLAQAMYGDIIAALNSIKGDTSAMVSYMSQALTTLNSISTNTSNIYSLCSTYLHYLAQIASTSTSIDSELKAYHENFMSMMDILTDTIVDESGNIQAKMEEIYNLLIAYLDTQFSGAVNPQLGQLTDDNMANLEIQQEMESGFDSMLLEGWTSLELESYTFDEGYSSALAWVSSWFSNFFNAFGVHKNVILAPLYLGLILFVLGILRQNVRRGSRSSRVSRSAGKGSDD